LKVFRPLATAVSEPLARLLAATPITPNAVTILGLILNVLVAAYIVSGDLRIGGALVLFAGAFDMLDGALARISNRASRFGAFLDSTLERVSEAAILFGLAGKFALEGDLIGQALAFLALVGSLMVSYTRARAEGLGVGAEVGLLDRPARVILTAAGMILGLTQIALGIIAALTAVTVVQRILHVRTQLED
jgi:CDP-diacylglycerol--glycerol-3-phosphate 3-phosphatidyltransferase